MPSSTKASKQVKSSHDGAMTSRVDTISTCSNRQSLNNSNASSTSGYPPSVEDLAQMIKDVVKHIMSEPSESKNVNELTSPPSATSKTERQRASKLAYTSVKEVWESYQYNISELSPTEEVSDHDEYLFVVRTRIDKNTKEESKYLDIKSEPLRDLLRIILKDVHAVSLLEDKPSIEQNILFGFLSRLEEHAPKSEDQCQSEHLRVLLEYLKAEFTPVNERSRRLLEKDEITYDLLWTIFPPNDEEQQRMNGTKYLELKCHFLDFDGKTFGEASISLTIDEFRGAKRIHTLPSYPLKHHPSADEVRQELIQCGRIFITLMGVHQHTYEGQAFYLDQKDQLVSVSINNGRIMVDPTFFFKKNSNHPSNKIALLSEDEMLEASSLFDSALCVDTQSSVQKIDIDPLNLPEEKLLICAPCVRGFSLEKHMWLEFAVARIKDIVWNHASWDNVAIPDDDKTTIQALCTAQADTSSGFDDFIAGKGKGLVALLHGPSGVWQDLNCRSNIRVSAGDLGASLEALESRLSEMLELASHWKAILLLDEADVSIEERSSKDLYRNALVCVFLRKLEDYDGIMFLTTNRVQTIDAVVATRISASIKYLPLKEDARKRIWLGFLARATTPYGKASCGTKALERLSREQINGREIKNATAVALAVATAEHTVVSLHHLISAIERSKQFQTDFRGAGAVENQNSYA